MTIAVRESRHAARMAPADHAAELDEVRRVAALLRLGVLDQPRRTDLDGLARLAAYVCGSPTSAINLIDADRQSSAAAFGWAPSDVAREDSMCAVSMASRDVSYTADASTDPRWSDSPFVTGVIDDVRFYAAAPLVLTGGEIVGTLCAFGPHGQELSRVQIELLRDLAEQAVRLLELDDMTTRLQRAALRDPLTGLPNRALFEESLQLAMARFARGEASPSVVFIDLDGFKAINDNHGHAVGDELLAAVSTRLLKTLRGSDLLARLGGDEFVVLCETQNVDELTRRLRAAFATAFELSFGPVEVGASIGTCTARTGSDTDLLAAADAAMYADKHRRRSLAAALRD